ncbi:hypothetical protein BSSC8_22380 [Bacillus subtilis subsp. subtilis str. SC-8]|nr:hypothetical protein BSSC8_22380 [Bacillus subtilis subsp. subtilis str. SC-8]
MEIEKNFPGKRSKRQIKTKGDERMQTLDAPIYEVKQESDWYKSEKKRKEDINSFFDKFEEKYGV